MTTTPHKVGDLVEDNEGDKAVVIDVDPERGIRVNWDCTEDGHVSGWLNTGPFTNLSERMREAEPTVERPREAEGDWHFASDRGGVVAWLPWRHDDPIVHWIKVADDRAGYILAATLKACEAYPISPERDNQHDAPRESGA